MNRIGLDTNVLLRMILADDPDQTRRAADFVTSRSQPDAFVVSSVVLAEVYWTLRTRKESNSEIARRLRELVDDPSIVLSDAHAVRLALADYDAGFGDFSDRLIARINEAHGASQTFTFDRKAARHPPLALVP